MRVRSSWRRKGILAAGYFADNLSKQHSVTHRLSGRDVVFAESDHQKLTRVHETEVEDHSDRAIVLLWTVRVRDTAAFVE